MDQVAREMLVCRICSGCLRLRVGDVVYHLRRPDRMAMYAAQEVCADQLYEAKVAGLYSDGELAEYLYDSGLWDGEREKLMAQLPKEIEEFKLKLYQASFRSSERKVIRKALQVAREKLAELESERHAYDHLSCSGAAALARSRYVLGASLYAADGRPVYGAAAYWEESSNLLERVMAALAEARVGEPEYRELARTEPWRSLWNCRKAEGSLFGTAAVDYTDEQRALVNYTLLYDSAFEHPDCPGDEIINDDDMMDGWLIFQRREREKRQTQRDGDELVANEKVRSSQEVYLVADTVEDARKVVDLNDDHAKSIQRQRFQYLKEKGEVNEVDMPDTKQRLRMEVVQKLTSSIKGAGQ